MQYMGVPRLFAFCTVVISRVAAQGPNSCLGKCGEWSDNCWCNEECTERRNCCSDYSAVCGASCKKCPGQKYNCDEWISWDPSKYTCQSLEHDSSCNCTGCSHCGGPLPANAALLTQLDPVEYPDAQCLDGSQAGYYMRKGVESKYLIHLEGGGWCYDQHCEHPTKEGTLKDCQDRASTRLGSSTQWDSVKEYGLKGMLSADRQANPVFHDWTLIYVPYCDGASFSGDAVIGNLHFKGKAILHAVFAQLKNATNIQKAERVVVSGGSAGASAVYYHIDTIADQLHLTSGEVLGIPDAGFFLNMRDKDGIDCWPAQMRSLFDVSNGYTSLHSACLQRFPAESWKCLFPENYADLLQTRMFVINTLYDSSEISYTLRLKCCPGGCGGSYPTCSAAEMNILEALRWRHAVEWTPLVSKKGNGVWAPACIDHTVTAKKWTDQSWEVPANSGVTQAAAVQKWLF
mmetsp:Transcript_87301/g.211784  ORF Transcript_87301/g.211784 Transcript_87301/m.211784 type:complete len:459 (-) Transcript_87301:22-1398(-)